MFNRSTLIRWGLWSMAALVLTACAATGGAPTVTGNWQEIGLSGNGNVHHAIDKSSIRRQGALATFRDKKTIIDMKQERYSNTPAYKVAISNWEMDCSRRTFRLTAFQLLDAQGKDMSQNHTRNVDLRPMAVVRGSATEKQFELVCGQKL